MAVENKLSTNITKAESPMGNKLSSARINHGRLRESVGTLETAAADDDDSVFRFMPVHSSWRISEILLACDALTGSTSWDIGLYSVGAGAVVDSDLFASAVNISSGLAAWTNQALESGTAGIENVEKQIFELLGLTVDPNLEYDMCMLANTIGSGVGTISMKIRYSDGT